MRLRHLLPLTLILLTACNFSLPFGLSIATPTQSSTGQTPAASPTALPALLSSPVATMTITPTAGQAAATATASPTPIPPFALTFMRMLDANNGWGADGAHLYRTNDGGATWLDVTPSGMGAISPAPAAYFLDISHGWIVTGSDMDHGTLFYTVDGGLSWSTASTPFGVAFGDGFLRFVDAHNGWMMSDRGSATGKMAVALFQTTDGGKTWKRVYHNDPTLSGAGTSLPLGGRKQGLTAGSIQRAWIGGATNEPGTTYLFMTTDSGHTWVKQNPPLPAGSDEAFFITDGPIFLNAREGFLPVQFSSTGIQTLIYDTRDGGANWTLTPGSVANGRLVDFVGTSDGFIWANQLYVTHDGAQNWAPVTGTPAFGENLSAMDFVDSLTGWALVADNGEARSLYKTTDGGVNWTKLAPVVTSVRTARTTIYLTLVGDNGKNGDLVGCGDSLVPVEMAVAPSDKDQVQVALEALFGVRVRDFEGKYNGLYLTNLQFVKSTVTDKRIVVYLSGQVASGGECDDPRIIGQVRKTISQFGFQDITVLVGGRKLEDLLSLKGK